MLPLLLAITASLTIHALIPAAALSPDGLALLAFKSAVSGDPTSALASWEEEDADPCHWPGVSCANISSLPDPNRVVAIALAGKNLSGYIPSELGLLLFLRRLNLHGNRLSGAIPSQLFNATSLHSLFLYDNNLSGHLPPSLCDPPRLQNLDLSRNLLSGTLPTELGGCHQLQRLFLTGNRFSGRIPVGIWPQIIGLVQLDISSNAFEGFLPPDIGDLDSLTGTLNLSNNYFSGPIPKSLGNISPAVSLDLSYNNFSGEIPQSGSLLNQGFKAFLNNPGLCGFPLKIPCSEEASAAAQSSNDKPTPEVEVSPPRRKGLRPGLIVLISMADAAGVAFVGLVIVYAYWKVKDREREAGCSCTGKRTLGGEGDVKSRWQCGGHCWKAGDPTEEEDDYESDESEISIDNEAGEGRLVSLDRGFHFELDELLRASAYVLGKGGLGIVYKVVLGNGAPVAVRRLGEGGAKRYKEFAGEAQAIGKARHPNVVRLRAFYWAPDEKLLISDFISNGNLAAALRANWELHPLKFLRELQGIRIQNLMAAFGFGRSNLLSLSWPIRLRIAKGVALGLAFLHDYSPRNFVHGNIKPSNILLGIDHNPFISDFGLTRLASLASATPINPNDSVSAAPSVSSAGGFIGAALPSIARPTLDKSNPYQAPEARFPCARPTQKWDVYSFGVVLLELITGRHPETTSPLSTRLAASTSSGGPELVRWVRKGFEEACPLTEMVAPALLSEVRSKKEVVTAFHVALACTETDPEVRPRMKVVFDSLSRIGL
ncbi:putative inactive leucine-rich repeat receptor-like protein kinase [Platanthera zijinensis]|uniref:Inactive leucine-rich repeat receptor-like protein kinase n=1 Tax=Platanthera zijinensis TaxID=2320716 RepID=A0AAP0B6F1_9ASPA